jgi:hypothetical protein
VFNFESAEAGEQQRQCQRQCSQSKSQAGLA